MASTVGIEWNQRKVQGLRQWLADSLSELGGEERALRRCLPVDYDEVKDNEEQSVERLERSTVSRILEIKTRMTCRETEENARPR